MKKLLKVPIVEPGMFSSERYVAFEVKGKQYALLVDEKSVQDKALEVFVVASQDGETLIELPRDPFNAGRRLIVPSQWLLPA
jgi:hypothetical protein